MGFTDADKSGAPSRSARTAIAVAIATLASLLTFVEHIRTPNHPADFGLVWFGARSIIHRVSPYELVGPGLSYDWPWGQLLYPATAMVVALPLAAFPLLTASMLFVWISSFLLVYAVTAEGWQRLPMFLSVGFVIAVRAGQWSPLLTAAFCIPSLAWVFAAKPNIGLALLASTPSLRALKTAVFGGMALTIVSLLIYPAWPIHWFGALKTSGNMNAPITLPGGVFVLLALLRWRRPEARLIVALACVPQTNSWYEALPLLLVASTLRENLALSLVSSFGFVFGRFVSNFTYIEIGRTAGILMVAFAYLPATLLVLLRKNEGERPAFLTWLLQRKRFSRYRSIPQRGNANNTASQHRLEAD